MSVRSGVKGSKARQKRREAPPHQHRMCVVCRGIEPKERLIRLRVIDGQVLADSAQTLGRGCYLHETAACIAKLREGNRLEHAFRIGESPRRNGSKRGENGKRGKGAATAEQSVARDVTEQKLRRIDLGSIQRLAERLLTEYRSTQEAGKQNAGKQNDGKQGNGKQGNGKQGNAVGAPNEKKAHLGFRR